MRRLGLIVFLSLLAAPLVALVLGFRPALLENRALEPWPKPTVETLVSGAWFGRLDEALVQRLPLRRAAVDAKRTLWVDVLGERRFDRVVIGDDDMLFLRPTLQAWCGWSEPWNVGRRAGQRMSDSLGDTPFLWVAVPDKFLVHGDLLPDRFEAWRRCAERRRARYSDAMGEALGERFIDLAPAIQAARDVAVDPVYYQEDTHWTGRTGVVFAEAVAAAWAPGTWRSGQLERGQVESAYSDLALQLGLERQHDIQRWRVARAGVGVGEMERTERVQRQGIRRLRQTTEAGVDLLPGTTLVIHDSFLIPVTRTLAPFTEELVLVQWEDLDRARFRRLLGEADRVVFQSIDRLAVQRQRQRILRWLDPSTGNP